MILRDFYDIDHAQSVQITIVKIQNRRSAGNQ